MRLNSLEVKKISESNIKKLLSFLDKYIEEREIGIEIYEPLNNVLDEVERISSDTYENFKEGFSSLPRNDNIANFLLYHNIRNLKLTTYKIIDSFKIAKEKALNPLVAKNLRKFIEPYFRFLLFLKLIKQSGVLEIDLLSGELEKFRDIAESYGFLCSLNEELKYDKITHKEFRELMDSMSDIKIEECH